MISPFGAWCNGLAMCGRLVQTHSREELARLFGLEAAGAEVPVRYNLAPGQEAAAVLEEAGRRVLRRLRWGLARGGINLRGEGLAPRLARGGGLGARPCVVPAAGFYEWPRGVGGRRLAGVGPWYYCARDGAPLALAGLWEPEGEGRGRFAILTTRANPLVARVHPRMPLILPRRHWDLWLEGEPRETAELERILAPYPPERMRAWRVSPRCNSVRHDDPDCLRPAPEQPTLFPL